MYMQLDRFLTEAVVHHIPSCKASRTQADTAVDYHIYVHTQHVSAISALNIRLYVTNTHQASQYGGPLKLAPTNITKLVPCI